MRRKSPDPLAFLRARGRIDRPQFMAGEKYRRLSALAERSPEALEALARCRVELGDDGTALVDAVLLCGMSTKQVAEARGRTGQAWESYFARRLCEALNTLAIVFGFVTKSTPNGPLKPAPPASP